MALLFELEADCVSQIAAQRFGEHFANFSFSLPDGRVCGFTESDTHIYADSNGHARCCLISVGASLACAAAGRDVLHTDEERRDFILLLYGRLRNAPPFRFAVTGLECMDFSLSDCDGRLLPVEGLVICDQVFLNSACPAAFQPFVEGYHWVPFTKDTRIF